MKRFLATVVLLLTSLVWLPVCSLAGRGLFYGADRIGTTSVTAITQTSDGFLWVGTSRGLLRFDGYRFARAPLQSPGGPLPAEVTTFCTDSLDRLWVGMDHGLAVFDRATASFAYVTFPGELKPRVSRLSLRPDGAILVGTSGYSSFVVDVATLEAEATADALPWEDIAFVVPEPVVVPPGLSEDLGDSHVEAAFSDRSGNLWLGLQRRGLAQFQLSRKPVFHARAVDAPDLQRLSFGSLMPSTQMPEGATSLLCDSAGCYWAGSANALWRRNGLSDSWHQVARLPGDDVNVIQQLGSGQLAVSTYGAGLALIDRATGHLLRQFSMHDADTLGHGRLSNDWIYSLDTDTKGRLWIATSSGVCCYDPVADDFHPYGWGVLADDSHCTSLLALASGDVLIASEQGLRRWSAGGGLTTLKGTDVLQGRAISSMAQDAGGDLWFCTDEGVWRFDAADHKMVAYTSPAQLLRQEFMLAPAVAVAEFIRNIRLEQAARLLREHKLNVSQVAYSVGFSSIGYFSTTFRKHFGVSPREFS